MAVEERDPHSGHMTTGHAWNGIKELNTPVPKTVWFFLILTALFSVGYWVLMPAWPTGSTFTKGLLGADDRKAVAEKVEQGTSIRAVWLNAVQAAPYETVLADPGLMVHVREDGKRLFGDNCGVCHGADGRGGAGFPNLTDNDWLWGGTPDTIAEIIRVGINSTHDETRVSQMMAFGADGLLDADAVIAVADYVVSLSDPSTVPAKAASIAKGREVFELNCTVCHGADGRGNQTLGAPDLTDKASVYGNDWASIHTSVSRGRQGQMPAWDEQLTEAERKLLTVYVLDLGRSGK